MSVLSAISDRLEGSEVEADRDLARLAKRRLRLDRSAVHVAVLQRLAANRLVSRGASAGALKGKSGGKRPSGGCAPAGGGEGAGQPPCRPAAPRAALGRPRPLSCSTPEPVVTASAASSLTPGKDGLEASLRDHPGVGRRSPPLPLHRQPRTRRPHLRHAGLRPRRDGTGLIGDLNQAEAAVAGGRPLRHRPAPRPRPGARPAGEWIVSGDPASLHGLRVPRPRNGGCAGTAR